MGHILSKLYFWQSSKEDDNFEQILSELEAKIYRTELSIAESKLKSRRMTALLTTYSILIYVMWLGSYFMMTWPGLRFTDSDAVRNAVYHTSPVVLVPVFIYSIRWMVKSYYSYFTNSLEQELETHRKQQKNKVEELKKKMKYYTAKNLIERYDSSRSQKESGAGKGVPVQRAQSHTNPRQISAPVLSNPGAAPKPSTGTTGTKGSSIPQKQPAVEQYQRTWMDRLLDTIIGEEAPTSKYALVCRRCFSHNGLATAAEFEHIQYICPKCGYFNSRIHENVDAASPVSPLLDSTSEQRQRSQSASPTPVSHQNYDSETPQKLAEVKEGNEPPDGMQSTTEETEVIQETIAEGEFSPAMRRRRK